MFTLVVGASGVLGRETTRLLVAGGHRVRAMTRSAQRAAELVQGGAEVVIGDLVDAASLARACEGVEAVVAAAHSLMGRGRYRSEAVDGAGHRRLIDAARGAGVSRFVYVSALGAAPDHPIDFFRTKFAVERDLQGSGMEHAILRPAAFMEWHMHAFNGRSMLEKGRSRLIGSGEKPRNFIAARDVARFAVLALTEASMRNRVLEIGGPANLSNSEVAKLYASTAGIAAPRISRLPASVAAWMGSVASVVHPGLARVMRLASLPDDAFSEVFDPTELRREFDLRLTTPQEFVQERVSEWRLVNARI